VLGILVPGVDVDDLELVVERVGAELPREEPI
jgi:hypothetical protein